MAIGTAADPSRTGLDLDGGPGLDPPAATKQKPPARDPQIGRSFRVPYRLTETNHFLVRVRINGKGPFNFLVDSGAPELFVATERPRRSA